MCETCSNRWRDVDLGIPTMVAATSQVEEEEKTERLPSSGLGTAVSASYLPAEVTLIGFKQQIE